MTNIVYLADERQRRTRIEAYRRLKQRSASGEQVKQLRHDLESMRDEMVALLGVDYVRPAK